MIENCKEEKKRKGKNKINAKSPVLSALQLDEKCCAPMIFPMTRKSASYWES